MSLTQKDLDQIDWHPADTQPSSDGIPHATHSGVLRLGDVEIRVYRLNSGEVAVHQDDFLKFLGWA